MSTVIHLDSPPATLAAGGLLARIIRDSGVNSLVVYLVGDLGVGKTTLVRGILYGLGHTGRVPSPTYTLIEPYDLGGYAVAHIDLYRLRSPDEVDALALEELQGEATIILVEWPENGGAGVPQADLRIELAIDDPGRILRLIGVSGVGKSLSEAASATDIQAEYVEK